jgi:hypothetical protein
MIFYKTVLPTQKTTQAAATVRFVNPAASEQGVPITHAMIAGGELASSISSSRMPVP